MQCWSWLIYRRRVLLWEVILIALWTRWSIDFPVVLCLPLHRQNVLLVFTQNWVMRMCGEHFTLQNTLFSLTHIGAIWESATFSPRNHAENWRYCHIWPCILRYWTWKCWRTVLALEVEPFHFKRSHHKCVYYFTSDSKPFFLSTLLQPVARPCSGKPLRPMWGG